ncbi:chemotaxis protein CheW [Verrucomicrobiota bacterium]
MNLTKSVLLFTVGDGQFALDVHSVERVVPAAATRPLPDAPESFLGLINIAGKIMPVIDARRHFGFPPRQMQLTDRFIVTQQKSQPAALLVDRVEGVIDLPEGELNHTKLGGSAATTSATISGSIVLIQNIASFTDAAKTVQKTDA